MGSLLVIGMFNLISLFRALNLDNQPYKFGNGGFWKFIGPLGFFLGLLFTKNEIDSKVPFIIGAVFNLVLLIGLFLL